MSIATNISNLDARGRSNNGRVAIITRTRDRPVLLARALRSILAQTYANWHLTIVNDGGDKGTLARVLESHASAFENRLSVIHHQESQGAQASARLAIGESTGEYLCLHDDDDTWANEFLAKTTAYMASPEHERVAAVAVCHQWVAEHVEGERIIEEQRGAPHESGAFIDIGQALQRNPCPSIAMLVRRSIVEAVGLQGSVQSALGEWDYTLRVLMIGDIGVIPETLAFSHIRRRMLSGNYRNADISATEAVLHRNDALRRAFCHDSSTLGAVSTILHHLGQADLMLQGLEERNAHRGSQLLDRLGMLERSVSNISASAGSPTPELSSALERIELALHRQAEEIAALRRSHAVVLEDIAPVKKVWDALLAPRRLLARMRGRI